MGIRGPGCTIHHPGEKYFLPANIIFAGKHISEKQFQYPADSPPLEYETPYYWKVIAYDENGIALGDYSAIATFNTPTGMIEIEFIYEEGGG